jgi:hypothetical protein
VYNGSRVSFASLSDWDNWTVEDLVMDLQECLDFTKSLFFRMTHKLRTDLYRWTLHHC